MATTSKANLPANTAKNQAMAARSVARPIDEEVKKSLQAVRDKLADVLPGYMTAEKQIQVVSIMAFGNPKLAHCDRASLLSSVVRAASYGLDLDPVAQEAFLIPRGVKQENGSYRDFCFFQIGFQGLRKLALQSGQIALLRTDVVYANDPFRFAHTPSLDFYHEPRVFGDRGPILGVYSHAELTSGAHSIEVMSEAQVNEVRDKVLNAASRKGKDGKDYRPASPWDDHWSEMARKTVLKRHCKSLPRSMQLDRALHDDNLIYDRIVARVVATMGSLPAPGRGVAGLRQAIEAREPSFAIDQGVAVPLRSEADETDYPPYPDEADEAPRGREPGDD